jgi:glycosyltransferase involved in cell wall biosynthesis
MKVFYWAPFTSKVATVSSVINSAHALSKFSKNRLKPYIINVFGEWNPYLDEIKEKRIDLISLYKLNLTNLLFADGYFRSLFSHIFIYFSYFFSLIKLIKKEKPEFLIAHLITSLPLTLLLLFNFRTKIILRISGYPKLNFYRKFFWKLIEKKLFKVTFPSIETYNLFLKKKIFNENKMEVLYDPVIDICKIKSINKNIFKNNILTKKKYILSVGRLTRQKNFKFLINFFSQIEKNYPELHLVIIGEGELKNEILLLIKSLNLEKKILLLGYQNNIYKFMNESYFFVTTSLWEDPGFVMIEAAASNATIISSDCPSGPKEFLDNNKCGYLFKSNNIVSLVDTFNMFNSEEKKDIFKKKYFAKRKTIFYTKFRHFIKINEMLR